MPTPEINSAEFFGLTPGTPEYAAFNNEALQMPEPISNADVENYIPPSFAVKIARIANIQNL